MSILNGGIFSNPRGKTGGVVFGAARTRQGKRVTSRLLVSPSNPNTALQQAQRGIFSYAQDIVRRIGSGIYQTDWNRAIGQLPGFQSMQSIFMKQTNSAGIVSLVTPINLGTLEPLKSVVVTLGGDNSVLVAWDGTVTGNGTDNDQVKIICLAKDPAIRALSGNLVVNTSFVRSEEEAFFPITTDPADYEFYIYAVGAGTSSGLISVANPYSVSA